MKIKQFITFAFTFAFTFVSFVVNASPITLRYKYSTSNKIVDPIVVQPVKKKTPILPINADQADHVLTFSTTLMDAKYELILDGLVVFSSIIDQNGCVELPEDLNGEYELLLYNGDKVYSAKIDL